MRGPFVVIEGADSVGKSTQTRLLIDRLKKYSSAIIKEYSFPQYDKTFAGMVIGEYLSGKYGDFVSMHPYLKAIMYAMDRMEVRDEMIRHLSSRGMIVADRFTTSQLPYALATIDDPYERMEYVRKVEEFEYDKLKIPKPTMVVYLDVPIEVSQELMSFRDGKEKDAHEVDVEYQKGVIEAYRELSKERDDWTLIKCTSCGRILPAEIIHEMIWRIVNKHENDVYSGRFRRE